ncbi:MAG: leucine-rich repeat domain-containing protein [Candidatus Thorarchaeota archaeon]
MSPYLTPNAICSDLENNKISKSLALDLLISLIEGSDDTNLRTESILALKRILTKSKKLFKILENCIVSDENALIRSAAAEIILHNYIDQGLNTILWALEHDKSPLVLNAIIKLSENYKKPNWNQLIKSVAKKVGEIANNIGIIDKEALFILDIESIFASKKPSYDLDLKTYDFYKEIGDSWLEIKNEQIISLNFNFFNWFLLKENPTIFNSLNRLIFPEIYLNLINDLNLAKSNDLKIPESIGNLNALKSLDLSHNYIKELPISLSQLKSLKYLNLGWNNFQKVPDILFSLTSLEILDLSHNNIKEIPSKIKNLNSLNELNLDNNNIREIPKNLKNYLSSIEEFTY